MVLFKELKQILLGDYFDIDRHEGQFCVAHRVSESGEILLTITHFDVGMVATSPPTEKQREHFNAFLGQINFSNIENLYEDLMGYISQHSKKPDCEVDDLLLLRRVLKALLALNGCLEVIKTEPLLVKELKDALMKDPLVMKRLLQAKVGSFIPSSVASFLFNSGGSWFSEFSTKQATGEEEQQEQPTASTSDACSFLSSRGK